MFLYRVSTGIESWEMDGGRVDWMSRILIPCSDAIRQENQVRCILLALSGEI